MTFDDKEAVVLEMRFQKIGVTFRPVYKVHVRQKGKGGVPGLHANASMRYDDPFPTGQKPFKPAKNQHLLAVGKPDQCQPTK